MTVVVVVSLQYATNICTLLQYSHSHFKFVLPGFDNDCVKQSWFEWLLIMLSFGVGKVWKSMVQ